jgi:hypothetical protein
MVAAFLYKPGGDDISRNGPKPVSAPGFSSGGAVAVPPEKKSAERTSFGADLALVPGEADMPDRNGAAVRRSEINLVPKQEFNPPPKSEETMTRKPILRDDEHFERFFLALLAKYPRRDMAEYAREALRNVLADADDPGQLRCCLLDGVARYEADMRAKGSQQFITLRSALSAERGGAPNFWSSISPQRRDLMPGFIPGMSPHQNHAKGKSDVDDLEIDSCRRGRAFRKLLAMISREYRDRPGDPGLARIALRNALDESDDKAQTRTLIAEAVHEHRAYTRSDSVTLAEFIEGGSWRAENLEFNRASAA